MTASLLFLVVGAAALILAAVKNSVKIRHTLNKHSGRTRYLPQAISMLVITAQISELLKTIEHVSIVHVAAALFMISIVIATTSGTESELH